MQDMQKTGQLSALIQRVHDDETTCGYATKEHLIDVCEFIVSWRGRYSRAEYSEALKLLAHYHLARLANIYHSYRSTCRRLINAELAKPYVGRCRRCGLPLKNPVSVEFGHGPVCRKKLGISSARSLSSNRQEKTIEAAVKVQ
jgi:hypothetical protein